MQQKDIPFTATCVCISVSQIWTNSSPVWQHYRNFFAALSTLRLCLSSRAAVRSLMWPSPFPLWSEVVSVLVDGPVCGIWWWVAGGFFERLIWAMAVGRGVGNAWTAGRCRRAGRRLGLNLQPLVSQGFGKVVIHRHADGKLLGAGVLVINSKASLEMLVHNMFVVAFGNHWWWSLVDLRPGGGVSYRGDASDHRRTHLDLTGSCVFGLFLCIFKIFSWFFDEGKWFIHDWCVVYMVGQGAGGTGGRTPGWCGALWAAECRCWCCWCWCCSLGSFCHASAQYTLPPFLQS